MGVGVGVASGSNVGVGVAKGSIVGVGVGVAKGSNVGVGVPGTAVGVAVVIPGVPVPASDVGVADACGVPAGSGTGVAVGAAVGVTVVAALGAGVGVGTYGSGVSSVMAKTGNAFPTDSSKHISISSMADILFFTVFPPQLCVALILPYKLWTVCKTEQI